MTPYDIALSLIGTKDIPGSDQSHRDPSIRGSIARILSGPSQEYSGPFIGHCARVASYERPVRDDAAAWALIGTEADLSSWSKGDVVIFWRYDERGWRKHAALLDHYAPHRGLLYVLGRCDEHEVTITAYPVARLIGLRRLRSLDRLQGSTAKRL